MGILPLALAEVYRNLNTESIYSTTLSSPCFRLESGRVSDKRALIQEGMQKRKLPYTQWKAVGWK